MKKEHEKEKPEKKRGFLKRRRNRVLIGIVLFLVIVRLILPYVVLHYANKTLAKMPGYYGHIEDIDLAIYRGAYVIKDIYLHKADSVSRQETEFFDSKEIDLSVEWHALFDGKIVGELVFEAPNLRFTKDKAEPAQVAKDTNDFRKLLRDFMPLKVNRFEVNNGTLKYIDKGSHPPVDIQMDDTHILAENLTNVKDTSLLPSIITASANIYGGGMKFLMKLDPLAQSPTFDMNMELSEVKLPELNDFFKAYGKFDVNKGSFGLYTELAAKDEKFIGYVKPLIKGLDVLGPEDRDDSFLQKFWEGLVGGAGVVFRNQRHDQVATKIPLEGTFKKTNANLWYAILDVLRNAFIEALKPSLDQEINIGSVSKVKVEDKGKKGKEETKEEKKEEPKEEKKKGFFKKLFNKEKKESDKNDEQKSAKEDAKKEKGSK
jgi:hypothetical protein